MPAPTRREVFANLLSRYHNSFEGRQGDVFEHSPDFIRRVVVESGNADLAAATLRLDPRLTSTDAGAVAFSIAKAISEDKQLSPTFIDIELTESVLTVYFDPKTSIEKAERALSEAGEVGVIARPGDAISDGVVSDMFILAVAPKADMSEGVLVEMKKKFPPKAKKKDSDAGSASKCDADESKNTTGKYLPIDECTHYDLAEDVFGDEALARFPADKAAVNAVFSSLFGQKALATVLKAQIGESAAPDEEDPAAQRNRVIRVLAGRGYLPHGAEGITWKETADKAIGERVDALSSVVEKWQLVEGAGRSAATVEDFNAGVDEIADGVHESLGNEVFANYVDRIADLGLAEMSDEKRAALALKLSEAATKDEKVLPRVIRGLARAAMFERGLYENAAIRDTVGAWSKHVVESLKPVEIPENPADAMVADVLGA